VYGTQAETPDGTCRPEFIRMKERIIRLLALLGQFGLDPVAFGRSVGELPRFIGTAVAFRRGFRGAMRLSPRLLDCRASAGDATSEYFWQDLEVARWIFEARPLRHVDVGSRIDGFVAHVASFREVEVLDVRPMTAEIPGMKFRQADLMDSKSVTQLIAGSAGFCDSLSCLHVIEHFGLGRYGDPLDPRGFDKGIRNLARLLSPGGCMYLSTPMGRERVEFNANWVFAPTTILGAAERNCLTLDRLAIVRPGRGVEEVALSAACDTLNVVAGASYALVLMRFRKSE
jgi:hypothetical protein